MEHVYDFGDMGARERLLENTCLPSAGLQEDGRDGKRSPTQHTGPDQKSAKTMHIALFWVTLDMDRIGKIEKTPTTLKIEISYKA